MARTADPHRREIILRAATDVLIEQGYSEMRLADIAKRAGVAISTLYLYFDSKEEMVRAIADQISAELNDLLQPVFESLTNLADIERLIELAASYTDKRRDQIRVLVLDNGLRGVHTRHIRVQPDVRIQRIMQTVRKRGAAGSLHPYDPLFLVEMVVGFVFWFVTVYIVLDESEIDVFKAFCVQWLYNALIPPKESAPSL